MGCIYAVLYSVFPNTVASLDISKDLSNQLYDKYISKFRKSFSFDLIHFSNSFIADETKHNLSKKLVIEFNKLDIKKLSFWTGYATDYVSFQIAYYIFAKLINPDYQFCIKKTELKICFYEIDFDFTDENIDDFKRTFFCKKDGTLINIETEKDKDIHDALNMKLANKLKNIVEEIDLSQIIPEIITSYMRILTENKNNQTKAIQNIV